MTSDFWALLDLDAEAERTYRQVVHHPGMTAAEGAARTGLDRDAFSGALEKLVAVRLVREVGMVWEAIEPRTALMSLARHKQAILDQAGVIADELGAILAAARLESDPHQFFQVLRGPREIVSTILDLLSTAKMGVAGTVAPPYVADSDSDVFQAEIDVLSRGVSFRALYDSSALDNPAHVTQMMVLSQRGEQARVTTALESKFLVVDGLNALVPLARTPDRPEPTAIRLGASAVTDSMVLLFDLLWRDSHPVDFANSEPQPAFKQGLDPQLSAVLALLGNGMSDGAIAETLGVSDRTLRRWITQLQEQFRTSNRFQLGMVASRT